MLHVTSTVNTNVLGDILCTCCPRWVKTGVDTLWVRATAGGCRMILVTRLITGSRTDAGSLRIGDITERTWESELVAVFSSVLVGNLAWISTGGKRKKERKKNIDYKNWHCGMTVLFCAKFWLHVTCWVRLKKFFFQFRKKSVYAIPCNGPQLGISIRAGKYLSRIHHQQHVLQWLWDCFILQGM